MYLLYSETTSNVNKDLLLQLLTTHKWDIIDRFMLESDENFNMIGNIFNQLIVYNWMWLRLGSVFIFYSIIYGYRHMFNNILNDREMLIRIYLLVNDNLTDLGIPPYQYDMYKMEIYNLIAKTNNYNTFSLMMAFFSDNYHDYDKLFLDRVADYIMLQINVNNVSIEFLSYLTSLI